MEPLSFPTGEVTELVERLWGSFVGRCVHRFLSMEGLDRCIVLSSQAFTALIPLIILVSALAPAGQEDVVAQFLVHKFGLEGDAATSVEKLFTTPPGGTSGVSVFSALLLVFSGVSFARRFQKMYRAAWGVESEGVRSQVFAALGLVALLAAFALAYAIRSLVRSLPYDWLWLMVISAVSGFVLWTVIPYLLLNRRVHWRRLLVAGGLASVCTAVFGAATTVYMPPLVTRYTTEFGLFGITIALIGWLLAACGVIVATASVGAEFDASLEPWAVRVKTRLRLWDPAEPAPAVDEASAASGLNTGDLLMLARILVNWLILTTAVWAATLVVPGIDVPGGFLALLGVSLLFGLINAVLGPLLHLVALPLTVVTLGTFALVVNGVLLTVTAALTSLLTTDGLLSSVLGALVISVVTTVLELVLRPIAQAAQG